MAYSHIWQRWLFFSLSLTHSASSCVKFPASSSLLMCSLQLTRQEAMVLADRKMLELREREREMQKTWEFT